MRFLGHDLSAAEHRKVTEAIAVAEKTTSGEIVVVAARESDDYVHVPIHIATGLALATPLALPLLNLFSAWSAISVNELFLVQLGVFIVTAVVMSAPLLRYAVTPKRLMHKYAHRKAAAQFLARNMTNTKGRTGVLIFVSLLERYVEVIGDSEINAKLTPKDWQKIVDDMLPLLREKKTAEALILAVERCGVLLAAHFPPGKDNPNELPDSFIILT